MKRIRVAAAALNQTPLDWDRNIKNILDAIVDAKKLSVSILCLPELCITGYGAEDAFFSRYVHEKALELLETICNNAPADMIISVGLPLVHNNALYNTVALIVSNNVIGFVPKQHLCSDGIHYETRWFKPWPAGIVDKTFATGFSTSIGDLIFDIGGVKIGFEVCEDSWVADRPGIKLCEKAVDIILNPSASHFAFGKHEVRKRFVTEGSRAFRTAYIYSNLLGNEAGKAIFDGELIIASGGKIIAEGRRLSFAKCVLLPADIDIDENRTIQLQNGSFRPAVVNNDVVRQFIYPDVLPKYNIDISKYGIASDASKEEEFIRAVSLGLYDYMKKSGSNGFVVSLSGGADSSAVACLVRLMHDIAIKEVGADTVPDMSNLLTCVYQGTKNSSKKTLDSAEMLATRIGATFVQWTVDDVIAYYSGKVAGSIGLTEPDGKRLNWQEHDIALQNVQARARVPGVWMLANMKNALLLCTSNRSESSVAYFTADGDSCGGLSPIGGINKSYLLYWLKWMAGYSDMFTAALQYVNALIPTAELRPQETGQKDEDDLMPYGILNIIEEMAIRDRMSPVEVLNKLESRDDIASNRETLIIWIDKFFRLFARNQWKREKNPIAFQLDDHSLDPKTWARFPVLSGYFKNELDELKLLVE